jgi:hypothetical protein
VQVIVQQHEAVDPEGMFVSDGGDRGVKQLACKVTIDEISSLERDDCDEVGAAGMSQTSIVRHGAKLSAEAIDA